MRGGLIHNGHYLENLSRLERSAAKVTRSRPASAKPNEPAENLSFPLAGITYPAIGLVPVAGLVAVRGQSVVKLALVLANLQFEDGRWIHGMARNPIESSDVLTTAYAIRTLQRHAPAPERPRVEHHIARAVAWIERTVPSTTDDLIGRLYGLFWADRDRHGVHRAAEQLLREQKEDGSWAQKPGMDGDAYATGAVLFALHETHQLEVAADPFTRGVAYLLRTQENDGSSLVPTRAVPLNGYLESGS